MSCKPISQWNKLQLQLTWHLSDIVWTNNVILKNNTCCKAVLLVYVTLYMSFYFSGQVYTQYNACPQSNDDNCALDVWIHNLMCTGRVYIYCKSYFLCEGGFLLIWTWRTETWKLKPKNSDLKLSIKLLRQLKVALLTFKTVFAMHTDTHASSPTYTEHRETIHRISSSSIKR